MNETVIFRNQLNFEKVQDEVLIECVIGIEGIYSPASFRK